MQDVHYPYTLCLIRQDDHFLLLNRQKQPAMGMWNGVGGKIEPGETPTAAVIRETFEETGIALCTSPVRRYRRPTRRTGSRHLSLPR